MTNGEKIMQAFPDLQIDMGELEVYMWTTTHDAIDIPLDWWNEEYKEPNHIADADKMIEPTADNDSAVDCIVDVLGSYTDLDIPYKREIAENILTKLPSVTPQPCEDAVSRQEVLYLIADYDLSMGQVVKGIHALPSVTPQEPKTGHWIWCVGSHKCSNCEEYTCFSHKELLRYCPNCGAKMVEPQESEVLDD